MKKILYLAASLLVLASCVKDEGNYDYNPINEISIKGFGDEENVHRLMYLMDTLRIKPELECTMDDSYSDDNYIWSWELESRQRLETKTVGNTRELELPLDMTPGSYFVHLRVKDKKSGLVVSSYEPLYVELSFSKGLYVLGERENEEVQLDMVAMIDAKNDTVILKDMLKNCGLPQLKHGLKVFHTSINDPAEQIRVWIMTEDGSYWLKSSTMEGTTDNVFKSMFFTSLPVPEDAFPVECYPRIAMGGQSGSRSGYCRGFRLNDGSFVFTDVLISELYSNPINRFRGTPDQLVKLFPGCMYATRYMKAVMFYDQENERFVGTTNPRYDAFVDPLNDLMGDPFPMSQKKLGRTVIHMENTRNPQNADAGRSYALLKDNDGNYFIYAFYVGSKLVNNWSLKIGYWNVRKNLATDIDKAEKFLVSSSKLALYYVVGSKIYCYSFNSGNEKCEVVADFGEDEITWLDADLWTEITYDYIWVATYNKNTGGTLAKYKESDNPNLLEWTKTDVEWGGFPKIKDVAWRACYN